TEVSAAITLYLGSAAAALRAGAGAPPILPVHQALQCYADQVAAVRRDGLIRGQPGETAERFYALGFSLEQMHQNLCDLDRVVGEGAGKATAEPAGEADQATEIAPTSRSGRSGGVVRGRRLGLRHPSQDRAGHQPGKRH